MFSKKRQCFGVREVVFLSLAGFLCPNVVQAQQKVDTARHSILNEVIVRVILLRFLGVYFTVFSN